MEVNSDDMLMKSLTTEYHLEHLKQTFDLFEKYQMKLNTIKYTFRVSLGKFLGYLVIQRGFEANLDQIQALNNMPSQWCKKDIHRLNERIVELSRFISRSSYQCHNFFNVLKRNNNFEWSFSRVKSNVGSSLILVKPDEGNILQLYQSVSNAVSSLLIQNEGRDQSPIFYVSKVLQDAETMYSHLEKLLYALVLSARRLKLQFQSHTINVVTTYPLQGIIYKPVLARRWAL